MKGSAMFLVCSKTAVVFFLLLFGLCSVVPTGNAAAAVITFADGPLGYPPSEGGEYGGLILRGPAIVSDNASVWGHLFPSLPSPNYLALNDRLEIFLPPPLMGAFSLEGMWMGTPSSQPWPLTVTVTGIDVFTHQTPITFTAHVGSLQWVELDLNDVVLVTVDLAAPGGNYSKLCGIDDITYSQAAVPLPPSLLLLLPGFVGIVGVRVGRTKGDRVLF